MLCPNCQSENLSSSSFCSKCGKPFTKSRNASPKKKGPAKKTKSAAKKPKKSTKKKATKTKPEPQPLLLTGPVLLPESEETKERAKITMPSQEDYLKQKELQKSGIDTAEGKPLQKPEHKPDEPSEKPEEMPIVRKEGHDIQPDEPKKPLKLKLDPPHVKREPMGTMFNPPTPDPPTPVKPKPPQVKLRISSAHRLRPFLIIIIIAFLGIAAWQLLLHSQSEDMNQDKINEVTVQAEPRIVVLDFKNDAAGAYFAAWDHAIPHLLTSYLSQSSQMQVVNLERLYMAQKDIGLSDPKRLASEVNADLYLEGSYSAEGDTLNLDVKLKRARSGKVVFKQSMKNIRETEIFSKMAELTQNIFAHLKLPQSKEVEIYSPEVAAYNSFVKGKKLAWQKKYRESLSAFEEAVANDSGFAHAYVEMAKAYAALGYPSQAGEYYQKAQAFIDSVPERERYRIQGEFYRHAEKTYDIAREIYSRLLQKYPEDAQGNTHLGMLFIQLGIWDAAWRRIQINLQNRVDTWELCYAHALNFAMQEEFDLAEKILKTYIKNISDHEYLRMQLAWIHLMRGDFDKALKEINQETSSPSSYVLTGVKGDVFFLKDDLISAAGEYQKLVENEEPSIQVWGRQKLAYLYRQTGRFGQAREELVEGLKMTRAMNEDTLSYRLHLDLARVYLEIKKPQQALMECAKAWDIATQGKTQEFPREVLHTRGLALLSLRRVGEAQKTAADLKSLCEKGPSPNRMRYYFHLVGKIEMARRNYSIATEHFKQALALLPPQGPFDWHHNDHALFLDALGESYYADGNTGAAFEEFAKVITLMTGRLVYGDLYARSYYKMAKISEENLLNDTAARFYAKFLDFWGQGDSGHSEISDARRRLQATTTKGSDRPN